MTGSAEAEAARIAVVARLEAFLDLLAQKSSLRGLRETARLNREVEIALPSIRRILNSAELGLGDFRAGGLNGTTETRRAVHIGVGILRERADVEVELEAAGWSGRPERSLHPLVWDSARAQWNLGNFGSAIADAWRAANSHIQARVGCLDLADDELVKVTLSPELKDRPVLHFPGPRELPEWRSRQRGLHLTTMGFVAGCRNTAVHHPESIDGTEGGLTPATLSLVLHWLDQTVRVDP
jgi:hypothetical protein